jgi:2,3-bisphosphoglycerate-dependent phosphoglycerate mutase
MARDIYVVAHTQSQHHVEGRVGGWYDTPLTELGRRQAEAVAARIADLAGGRRPVEIYASDLLRASQTADAVAARLAEPVSHWSDLRERGYGAAGGQPSSWLKGQVVFAGRDGDRLDHRDGIDGAETKREFLTRIYRAMSRIVESPCATQVIVTHGFAVTFVVAAWIRMPLESAGWVTFGSNPGGITHLHEDDTLFNRHVMSLNDRAHLTGALA